MDRPDLHALVAHYKEALGLQSWTLDVSYGPDLATQDGQPVWGLCWPTPQRRMATIAIRDPMTPPPGATPEFAAQQVVETLVHELVHLHWAPLELRERAEVMLEEQAVDALAAAIVAARGTPQEGQIARAMLAIVPRPAPEQRNESATGTVGRAARKTSAPKGRAGARKMDLTLDELIKVAKALNMDPGTPVADIMAKLQGKAPAAPEEPAEPASEPPPPMEAAAPPAEPMDEEKAVARRVAELTGKPGGASVTEIERWRASHLQMESERAKLAMERATLEASERRALVARLVTDCGEAPATAWADDGATKPAEPWASMPLDGLRARVERLSKSPKARVAPPQEPAAASPEGLDARELEICKETGCDPKVFAALKARRASNGPTAKS